MLAATAMAAHATCYGSGSYQNCTDAEGNSYQVQRYGNTTQVQGQASNGNTWSQTSQTYGNTTQVQGQDASGRSWNETIQRNGNQSTISGTDAQGRSFYKSCYNGVCN